ncbi:MAG: metal-dependent hydrolase [Clostridia bacterium]|nr:metal-dependent hydrolase [Clostridia bacterium]
MSVVYSGGQTDRKNTTAAYIVEIKRELSHYLAHVLAALAAVSLWNKLDDEIVTIAIIASLLPDADVWAGLAHRTATHSLLAIAGIWLLCYASTATPAVQSAATIAYASHIAVDLLHGLGIQLIWPARRMYTIAYRLSSPPSVRWHYPYLRAYPRRPLRLHLPTRTPTLDYWLVEIARLRAERARADDNYTCRVYGQHSQRCTDARYLHDIARAEYCRLASCPVTP